MLMVLAKALITATTTALPIEDNTIVIDECDISHDLPHHRCKFLIFPRLLRWKGVPVKMTENSAQTVGSRTIHCNPRAIFPFLRYCCKKRIVALTVTNRNHHCSYLIVDILCFP